MSSGLQSPPFSLYNVHFCIALDKAHTLSIMEVYIWILLYDTDFGGSSEGISITKPKLNIFPWMT